MEDNTIGKIALWMLFWCIIVVVLLAKVNVLSEPAGPVPVAVPVETIVYMPSEQPCVKWEVSNGKAMGHLGLRGITPKGWEPIGAEHGGVIYRRCLEVSK